MLEPVLAPLEERLHPQLVELELALEEPINVAERELRSAAVEDRDQCCGYFPALNGISGIRADLPGCRAFVQAAPSITHAGMNYGFNFLRLSLVRQSLDPVFHLDSDAATALSGEVATLSQRTVLRLLLNLSSERERVLHYLDVDPWSTDLVAQGSYVRVRDPDRLQPHFRVAVIPPRTSGTVHGLEFASNRVLHSGLDGERGHFVAAYGAETTERSGSD